MFTLRGKATALAAMLGVVLVVSLFSWWLGLLAVVAATPLGIKVLRA